MIWNIAFSCFPWGLKADERSEEHRMVVRSRWARAIAVTALLASCAGVETHKTTPVRAPRPHAVPRGVHANPTPIIIDGGRR